MCFVWISGQTTIISLYSINWLVFITETECVYCVVRTESLTIPSKDEWLLYVPPGLTFTNSTFCPHSVFMCFVWISEQTAIISLYSINWLVFVARDAVCLLRGTGWVFIYYSDCLSLQYDDGSNLKYLSPHMFLFTASALTLHNTLWRTAVIPIPHTCFGQGRPSSGITGKTQIGYYLTFTFTWGMVFNVKLK
jgi:hypothetical protein